MNTDKIKVAIKDLVGEKMLFKVNLGRNKKECFEGIIENTYPSVFTVRTKSIIKSISYSDILTKDVIIKRI